MWHKDSLIWLDFKKKILILGTRYFFFLIFVVMAGSRLQFLKFMYKIDHCIRVQTDSIPCTASKTPPYKFHSPISTGVAEAFGAVGESFMCSVSWLIFSPFVCFVWSRFPVRSFSASADHSWMAASVVTRSFISLHTGQIWNNEFANVFNTMRYVIACTKMTKEIGQLKFFFIVATQLKLVILSSLEWDLPQ